MLTPGILFDGPDDAPLTIALAHGAGAARDSPFMNAFAEGLAAADSGPPHTGSRRGWEVEGFDRLARGGAEGVLGIVAGQDTAGDLAAEFEA